MSEPKPDTMMLMANIYTTGECVTIRSEMCDLESVVATFERFLKSAGFDFPAETLAIVPINKLIAWQREEQEQQEFFSNRETQMTLSKIQEESKK